MSATKTGSNFSVCRRNRVDGMSWMVRVGGGSSVCWDMK